MQILLVPELQGGTPSGLAAGYCVMLTHSLGRPWRIQRQPGAKKEGMRPCVDSQTAEEYSGGGDDDSEECTRYPNDSGYFKNRSVGLSYLFRFCQEIHKKNKRLQAAHE